MPSHLSLATGTCLVVHLSQSLASMTKNSSGIEGLRYTKHWFFLFSLLMM